jgi:small subunit ribosomal protein S6
MRRYETFFISNPDLSADDRAQLFEKTKDLIAKQGGFLVLFDEWGVKKLSYDIKKKGRGYYVRIDFCGDGALVAELERSFRIDDRVMKFMTIVLGKDVDLEKVKEEIAREAEAEAERAIATEDDDMEESLDTADAYEMEIENDIDIEE